MAGMSSVVHTDEVEPEDVGGAEVRVTFGAHNGSEGLEQRVVRLAPGRYEGPDRNGRQAVVYVVSGRGTVSLGREEHVLEPDMGLFIAPGEHPVFTNEGPDDLELVAVWAAADRAEASGERKVTVRYADQPELPASRERSFRYLVNEDAGCYDVTQFVGIVQPSKAPVHSHTYDEVGYVVEGEGIAHIDGEPVSLRAGSCFYLPPGRLHCIENSGRSVMRIMGVFHPSGSPAAHTELGNNHPEASSKGLGSYPDDKEETE